MNNINDNRILPGEDVTVRAYAKINLFLEVGAKRPDGYHEIDTVMNRISLCDELTLRATDDGVIDISCGDSTLPVGDGNLIYKAAAAFYAATGIKGGLRAALHKTVPVGAGLGGGSSDAASVLMYLNEVYGSPLDAAALCGVAKGLGADVPFFLCKGCARALGIGERLSYIPSLAGIPALIIPGREKVSTAVAYMELDRVSAMPVANVMWEALCGGGDLQTVARYAFNRFEDVSPYCDQTIRALTENGAVTAHLSGSGSSVYGLFASAEERDAAQSVLGGYSCVTI